MEDKNNVRVFIGNGKVAGVLKRQDDNVLRRQDADVRNIDAIESSLRRLSTSSVVINTAAKINLEWCQSNKDESWAVNVDGAVNVARVCMDLGLHLVHISSGCIFDGMETNNVYGEEDDPTPACWYTECKAEADQRILALGYDKVTIVRPRQLISATPNPTNMLTKFAAIDSGEFIDVDNSLTCIEDMGQMIDHLVDNGCYGVYNLANSGHTSPYRIATAVRDRIRPSMVVRKISYVDYLKNLSVKRVNTLLSIDKLVSTGFTPRSASDALSWCLDNYG